jgi:hypothetical protein
MRKFKFWLLKRLLYWFSTEELDQWDFFKMKTTYGWVYVSFSRDPFDIKHQNYVELE